MADIANPTRVDKPWGYELHWAKTDRYVGKLIHVNKGHALSLQYHVKKDETIYLHAGLLLFEIGGEGDQLIKREMRPGDRVARGSLRPDRHLGAVVSDVRPSATRRRDCGTGIPSALARLRERQ